MMLTSATSLILTILLLSFLITISAISKDEYFLLLYEFKVGLEDYLSQSSSSINTLEALIDFNNSHAKKMMPYFEQEIFYKSNETKGMTEKYKQALQMVMSVRY